MTDESVDRHVGARGGALKARAAALFVSPRPLWVNATLIAVGIVVVAAIGFFARDALEPETRPVGSDARVEKWAAEVADDPDNTLARIELGYAYQQAGKLEEAVSQYDAVLAREPRNVAALYNRGSILLSLNLDEEAEKTLWKALDAEPGHVGSATELGRLYIENREYRSALAAVRPVVDIHPESADLQYLTGYAYEKTGHADWAAARYRLALKASPDHQEAREGLRRLGEGQ